MTICKLTNLDFEKDKPITKFEKLQTQHRRAARFVSILVKIEKDQKKKLQNANEENSRQAIEILKLTTEIDRLKKGQDTLCEIIDGKTKSAEKDQGLILQEKHLTSSYRTVMEDIILTNRRKEITDDGVILIRRKP